MRKTIDVPFVDLLAEHAAEAAEIEAAMQAVVRDGNWILGADVARFEQEFAAYCGARQAVGTDSGMSALTLALRALGIGPGDEVIAPVNTFIATIFAIMHVGATPVLVDCEPETYQLDPERVGDALTARTKAIVPVHLYGHPADMGSIQAIALDAGLVVLEDACQAHGARLEGRRVGTFGDAAAFSFYPSKNLGAYGDGGMIVTDDKAVADELRLLRSYGQRRKNHHEVAGFNHRLDTLHAAILRIKLRGLDERNAARRERAAAYTALLADSPIEVPSSRENCEHVWHLYVIRSSRRDELQKFLTTRGIATGIHYPLPVHLQPACRELGYQRGRFPVAERCAKEILSLPMYPYLGEAALESVAAAIHSFHRARRQRGGAMRQPAGPVVAVDRAP